MMSGRVLPDDVHPESGFRLPRPDREAMDESARQLFDYFADPNSGSYAGLWGPGGIRLHSPRVAELIQPLNRYLRREAGIPAPVRELAILVTAREMDSQFEWAAHEPEALEAGVSPETIEIVRWRKDAAGLPETETVIILLGREMFGDRRVTSGTFARALKMFGRRGLVDMVSLMSNYSATASLLTAFDIQLKPEQKPGLPKL